MVVPNNYGFFTTKNDHFGVFWGTTILGNTHIYCRYSGLYQMLETAFTNIFSSGLVPSDVARFNLFNATSPGAMVVS